MLRVSRTNHLTELESLRLQVSELTRALREQASTSQGHEPDETLEDLREESRLLRTIVEGTAAATGNEFFASLVQHLTRALNVRYALIGEVSDGAPQMIRTLAVSDGGTLIDNFEYALTHAPCGTGLTQSFWCFEQGVQAQFPHFPNLAALGVESHCGVSFRDKDGAVTGMMIVMDTKPLTRSDRLVSLMEIFAARAAAELHRHKAELARQHMEQSLRDSEARTRSIIEGAMDGVVSIDRDGRIVGWNSEAEAIFGYAAHEVMGHSLSDTIIPRQHRTTHEAGIKRILACPVGVPVKRRLELHALHRDGHEFPVEFAVAMTHANGEPVFSAFIRDITEQARAAEDLHRTAETLRAVVQSAPVAIVTCTAEGLLTSWNPAAQRIFGWSE